MEAIRIHKVAEKGGKISVKGVPCKKGQYVEIILLIEPSAMHRRPRLTTRRLLRSGLIGLWKDRKDIGDSAAYARQLREQAQSRRRPTAHLRQCFHETVLKTEALFECQPP